MHLKLSLTLTATDPSPANSPTKDTRLVRQACLPQYSKNLIIEMLYMHH